LPTDGTHGWQWRTKRYPLGIVATGCAYNAARVLQLDETLTSSKDGEDSSHKVAACRTQRRQPLTQRMTHIIEQGHHLE
jgi:hypothetical protein